MSSAFRRFIRTAGLALAASCAAAQSNPVYIPFGPAKGALYKPDSGPARRVALIIMHRTAHYMHNRGCRDLSARGFMVLCMNTRFETNEIRVLWEQVPPDVKQGIAYLRKQPGISKVVLFGHTGGGPIMSFSQAVAENGPAYCKGPHKLVQCGDDLAELLSADAIVFADAHAGNTVFVMRGINPAVISEHGQPVAINPAVDPFSAKNGYNDECAVDLFSRIPRRLLSCPGRAHPGPDHERAGETRPDTKKNSTPIRTTT